MTQLLKSKSSSFKLNNSNQIPSFHHEKIAETAEDVDDNEYLDDDEVKRFDAESYHQKYGDRWKKFASTIRDVPQPDGSIIREYVIDDPSELDQLDQLDQLSEQTDIDQMVNKDNTRLQYQQIDEEKEEENNF
jgi:hypothetical protein